jgi:hypothetical protein
MDVLGRWPQRGCSARHGHGGAGAAVAFIGIATEGLQHEESRGIIAR